MCMRAQNAYSFSGYFPHQQLSCYVVNIVINWDNFAGDNNWLFKLQSVYIAMRAALMQIYYINYFFVLTYFLCSHGIAGFMQSHNLFICISFFALYGCDVVIAQSTIFAKHRNNPECTVCVELFLWIFNRPNSFIFPKYSMKYLRKTTFTTTLIGHYHKITHHRMATTTFID